MSDQFAKALFMKHLKGKVWFSWASLIYLPERMFEYKFNYNLNNLLYPKFLKS